MRRSLPRPLNEQAASRNLWRSLIKRRNVQGASKQGLRVGAALDRLPKSRRASPTSCACWGFQYST